MDKQYKILQKNTVYLKSFDYCIFALAALAFLATVFLAFRSKGGEELIYITTEDQQYIYNTTDSVMLTLEGPIGETEILIQDGAVRVVRSPGKEQLCVRKGAISRSGEWLICLPNQIFVLISTDADSVDSYSY